MLTLVVLVLGLAIAVIAAVPRRHREEPLRQEMDARPAATFTSGVRVLDGAGGLPVPARGSFRLVVRGDLVEVTNPFRPARLIGQQYCYRAPDMTVKVIADCGTTGSRSKGGRPARPP